MIYTYKRKSTRAQWTEDQKLHAIKSVRVEKVTIDEAAREFREM